MLTDTLLYLLTGGVAGFAAGLLGIGGGLIIVPVLYFVLSSQGVTEQHLMHFALATSLATIIVTSVSSTLSHHRRGAVLWSVFIVLAPGICIGAWLGGAIASDLQSAILKPVFGLFELLVAIHLITQYRAPSGKHPLSRVTASIGGLVIGSISAIVGIGGGTLTVPFLHWKGVAIRNAVATSAACGLPIAIFGTASYIFAGWQHTDLSIGNLGFVNLHAFVAISLATFIAAPAGARVAHSVPEDKLKLGFGLFLLFIGAKMLLG